MSVPENRNKVALVTGAARRIGAVIARTLHAQDFDVAIHYRASADDAEALVAELNASRADSAAAFAADLTDIAAIEQLASQVIGWHGRLDVLVNNASSFYPTPAGTVTEAQWDDLVGTNLKAPLFLSQAAAPALREARGSIVNIVDIHASRPLREHIVYGPAKAGLAMLTRSLAKDLAPEVRVNGVAPGAILWPDLEQAGEADSAHQSIIGSVPLGRTGAPEDIAETVYFLAAEAGYVTGEVIRVDGGRRLNL